MNISVCQERRARAEGDTSIGNFLANGHLMAMVLKQG